MTTYIYDIEVFSDDWIVVFRDPEAEDNHIVIHNDNHRLRAFLDREDIVLGGYNNRGYDDWVVLTMLLGGSNVEVKRHNDFIIKGRNNGWEFPFVQYKKRPFASFDLKSDLPKDLSLKAIEGNLYLPIVESSVDFDINRKLTPEELEEVIRYCKNDVDATVDLYNIRKEDYIDAKALVGEMYDVPYSKAIAPTNAGLSAIVLDAEYEERHDERDYVIPDNIDVDSIPKIVLDFFLQIRDKNIPDAKLFGTGKQGSRGMTLDVWLETSAGRCPVTYAWGGVHGAKPCTIVEETANRVIKNKDVGSLYPNSMINFGYCSRGMKDRSAYEKLVKKRLEYKKAGDKKRANALKLVVNTVYGTMLQKGTGALVDRWAGRSVCISNQLAMTMLIVQLAQQCETIDFVNINTDGIMYTIDKREVALADKIVDDWCKVTKFEMEDDDFVKVIQKDVNNYIGIKADGSFKTKGGFVSLYNGGNFKTNSLQIIDKAVVDYLVKGISPEDTIKGETDIFKFQQIVKTGGTYEGSYHYVNGERVPIQKVNRIYAVKDPKYGQVVKGKWITEKRRKDKAAGKMISEPVDPPVWSEDRVSECPIHTYIDNENALAVGDLDLDYYIDMAKGRIDKYINLDRKVENKLNKIKEVITIMANAKTEKTVSNETVANLNIYGKLIEARKMFLAAGIKKTGVNRYAEYKYFTLDDIIPVKQSIFEDLGLIDVVSFSADYATLTLVNASNPEETIYFTSPLREDESLIKNPIQKLGAIETYVRRYLYMLLLDIVESDAVEAVTDKPDTEGGKAPEKPKKSNRPATAEERAETKKELIDEGGEATATQIKAIKSGLKKLREKDADKYEGYVTTIVKKLKAADKDPGALKKKEAEDILIEIGGKIEE